MCYHGSGFHCGHNPGVILCPDVTIVITACGWKPGNMDIQITMFFLHHLYSCASGLCLGLKLGSAQCRNTVTFLQISTWFLYPSKSVLGAVKLCQIWDLNCWKLPAQQGSGKCWWCLLWRGTTTSSKSFSCQSSLQEPVSVNMALTTRGMRLSRWHPCPTEAASGGWHQLKWT